MATFVHSFALRRLVSLVVGLLLLLFVCSAPSVEAHGKHAVEVELFRGASGPYDLLVTAVPLVDYLDITVIFEPENLAANLSYEPLVSVSLRGVAKGFGPKMALRPFGVTANEYSVVFDPGATGDWIVTVEIDSELGIERLVAPLTLEHDRGFRWTAAVAAIGLALPIGWLVWGSIQGRARAKREDR